MGENLFVTVSVSEPPAAGEKVMVNVSEVEKRKFLEGSVHNPP